MKMQCFKNMSRSFRDTKFMGEESHGSVPKLIITDYPQAQFSRDMSRFDLSVPLLFSPTLTSLVSQSDN